MEVEVEVEGLKRISFRPFVIIVIKNVILQENA